MLMFSIVIVSFWLRIINPVLQHLDAATQNNFFDNKSIFSLSSWLLLAILLVIQRRAVVIVLCLTKSGLLPWNISKAVK